jgi:nitrogen fixation NifU-like protein
MYTKKVLQHFKHPHNYGKMKNPDGIGKVGNITCGDVMWLYIKVSKNKGGQEFIKDIKFETFGCVAAIAVSSIVTDLAKGKTFKAVLKTNKDKIVKSLGGLPPIKLHCSVLAADALEEAIYNYLSENKKEIPIELQKHHQRIKKEKKLIEDKYKDWIEAEEKIHKNGKRTSDKK